MEKKDTETTAKLLKTPEPLDTSVKVCAKADTSVCIFVNMSMCAYFKNNVCLPILSNKSPHFLKGEY